MEEKYLQVIRQSPLFRNLDEEQIRNVLQEGFSSVRVFGKGERVFSESDRPDKIRILLSGEVIVAKDTPGGKRSVLAVIDKPGDLFGEIYAFRNLDSYGMYAECTEISRILSLDICVLQIPVQGDAGQKQDFRSARDMETALKREGFPDEPAAPHPRRRQHTGKGSPLSAGPAEGRKPCGRHVTGRSCGLSECDQAFSVKRNQCHDS